jgi:hypothetical protein
MLARAFPNLVENVPEAASLLFSGGFPRFPNQEAQRAVQRAVFATQHELEAAYSAHFPDRVLVLDRGTVDGAAYWPEGAEAFFSSMGTNLERELGRYEAVIYLESAAELDYALHKTKNPHRKESWTEAARLDAVTFNLWSKHPRFLFIRNNRSFSRKVSDVLSAVSASLPIGETREPK